MEHCVNAQKIERLETDVKEMNAILNGAGSNPGLKGEVRSLTDSNNALSKAIHKLSSIVDAAVVDQAKDKAVKQYKRQSRIALYGFIGALGVIAGIIFELLTK